MKNRSLFLVMYLTLQTIVHASPQQSVQILMPGIYHGDEVRARTGQRWWALGRRGKRFSLSFRKILIQRVHDPVVDTKAQEKTGKHIRVMGVSGAVFLFRGLSLSSRRKVVVAKSVGRVTPFIRVPSPRVHHTDSRPRSRAQKREQHLQFLFQAKPMRLTLRHHRARWILLFSFRGKRQQLHSFSSIQESTPRPLWAGDLDQDGKPDLILDQSTRYNCRNIVLYLSSLAVSSQLLKRAAYFRFCGC